MGPDLCSLSSVLVVRAHVRACMTLAALQTSAEGQVSVCMEPINGARSRTPLPAFICCTGTRTHAQNSKYAQE